MKRLVPRLTYAARRASLSAVGGCLAALAFVGVAQAETVTVGGVLNGPHLGEAATCVEEPGCGYLTIDAGPPASAAVATADGTVTSWSVLDADTHPGYSANVVRKNPDGTYTVTASSAEVTPAEALAVQTFATSLPIHAGEYIELNVPKGGTIGLLVGPSHADVFSPGLAFGETRSGSAAAGGEELSIVLGYSAEIGPPALVPPVIPLPSGSGTTANVVAGAPAPVAAPCVIPKLAGKKLKVAKKLVRGAGCEVGLVSTKKGVRSAIAKVATQSPSAGKSVPAHTAVSLRLA
jgi:PASTA domain